MSQTSIKEQRSPDTTAELDIKLGKVFKVFNGQTAVGGVDLNVRRGEFFSILGSSDWGKTKTLRLIAGFETLSAADVLI
jgi:spermidine/putrescine transport system ATP-binding protein